MLKSKKQKKNKEKKLQKKNQERVSKKESLFVPRKIKIKVVGIGGGGAAIVSEMTKGLQKVSFLVADTDQRTFKKVPRGVKGFHFGENLTKGLGTGMNPELGEKISLNLKDKVENIFKGEDLVVLVGCLGGGVSSGAGPVFAEASKNQKNISLGIFTLPFNFEGEKKMRIAKNSLEKLQENLSGTIVFPNEKILTLCDKKTPLKKAFSLLNEILIDYLRDLINMISNPGIINIDFADLKTILAGRGKIIYFSQGEGQGPSRVEDAIKQVFQSPWFCQPKNIKRILFNITGGKDLALQEVEVIAKTISELNPLAKIIFGISNNTKDKKSIKITFLGVGESVLEGKEKKVIEEKKQEKKKSKKRKSVSHELKKKEIKARIRRSALEIKKDEKEKTEEELSQENEWELPAFLRNKMK